MKLHLPKQLFTAILAALFATAIPQTVAGDSLSINFYKGDEKTVASTTGGQALFGVDVTDWNDVTASGAGTQQLTVTTAEEKSLMLTLKTSMAAWGPSNPSADTSTLEDKLQASYLDANADNNWQITLQMGDIWLTDVTFYMAGDSGSYAPITVNGKTYIGGVDKEGTTAWGTRSTNTDGSASYSTVSGYNGATSISNDDLNSNSAVRVTSLIGDITASNVTNTTGRGSLAGLQVVDVTDSKVYAATLDSNEVSLSAVSWSKQGVETPSTLENISASERYLSVTADAAGSKLNVADATTIAGLQLVANNLTVDGSGTLTVGALHAKNGSTLTMNAALAGASLVLSGSGTISLKDFTYTGEVSVQSSTTVQLLSGTRSATSFVNHGTVQLEHGVTPGVKISNSGRVELQMGSNVEYLNDLVGKNWGTYKPGVIENTSTGDFVIVYTGNMSLNGGITINNGGKVTLKGGTFGTETAAITHTISSDNTTLVLDDVQSYLGNNTADQLSINTELTNGSVLHLLGNDRFKVDGTRTMTVGHDSLLDIGSSCQRLSGNTLKLAGGTVYGNGGANTEGSYTAGLDYHQSGTIAVTEDSLIATTVASRDADDVVTLDVAANKTLTIGSYTAGETTYTGSFVGSGSFTKSGSGKLTLSGTLGASGAALGSIRVNGGNLEILNTSYVTSVNMTGGNLTYGGTDVIHTISEGVTSSSGSQNSTFAVASGSTVNLASFNNAWGVNLDIDGTVTITGSLTQAFNSSGLSISGDGCVKAGSLDVRNQSKFDVAVTTLNVTGGFNMSGNSSKVTFTSGSTTTISGATNIATNSTVADSINKVIFEGGVAELKGAVTNGAIIEVNAGRATLNGTVTNTGSINVNGGTATLNGGISGAGTVALTGGSLILGSGEGVTNEIAQFNYSGGTLSYESLTAGAINIASGKVMSNSGHLTVTGSLAGSIENTDDGQVTFAKGASIAADTTVSISGTGTTLLAGTLSNAGTLNLAGQLGISGELQLDYTERSNASEMVYILDKNNPGNTNTNGDGFLQETGSSYWLIQGGTTTLADDITTSAGYTLTKVTEENKQDGDTVGDVYFTVSSSIGNTFYITSGAVNIVGTGGTKPDGAYNAEAVALNSNEAVLNLVSGSLMTSNITFSGSVTDDKAGTIKLSDGAVLNVDSLTSMGVTANQLLSSLVSATTATQGATPSGKILISRSGLNTGDSGLTTAFTGKVELAENVTFTFGSTGNAKDGQVINTSSLTGVILNNGSVLKFQGTGDNAETNGSSLSQFRNVEVNGTAEINLIDTQNINDQDAVYLSETTNLKGGSNLKLTASYDGRIIIDNLEGSGALTSNGTTYTNNNRPIFYTTIKGLDGFTGTLNFTDTAEHTVSVSTGTDADSVSFAGLNMAGGTEVNNTFNVQTNTTVGTVSLSGSSNRINLSEGKSLSVGTGTVTNVSLFTGSAEVASISADTPASLSHVKMTDSGFSKAVSAGSAKGSISNANVEIAQLAEDASFTIQDMTLTNTTITAATTTQVKLQNVTASNVVLAQGKFSTNADMAMVGMGGSEGTFSFAGGLAENEIITIKASAGASLTVDLGDLSCVTAMNPGKYNLSITLSGVALDSYTGLSEGAGIKFAGWLGELISASSDVQVSFSEAVAEETPAAAAESGATGVTYSTGSVGTVITITGLNVPEPATSTLSLLALAALAARRRRND